MYHMVQMVFSSTFMLFISKGMIISCEAKEEATSSALTDLILTHVNNKCLENQRCHN